MTEASSKSVSVGEDFPIPDRLDPILIEDFILKTVLPIEEGRVGYGVTEKIIYLTWVRFGDLVKPLVPTILDNLVKQGLVIEAPFPNCYRRAPTSPARDAAA